jgi:hypothetical protein
VLGVKMKARGALGKQQKRQRKSGCEEISLVELKSTDLHLVSK